MNNKIIKKYMIIFGILSLFFVPMSFALVRMKNEIQGDMAFASWNVTLNQNGINNYLSIIGNPNGTTASYNVNITGNAEVDIVYSITIKDLPTGVSVSLDGGEFIQEANHKVIINDVGTILYSDTNKTRTHTLTFKANENAEYDNNHEVNINVIARQMLGNE